jgi:hypothetical protein
LEPAGEAVIQFPEEPEAQAEALSISKVKQISSEAADAGFGAAAISLADRAIGSMTRVNRIEVSGNSRLSGDAVRKLSGVTEGEGWWSVSREEVVRSLKNSAWIEDASVSWGGLPVMLRVRVREAEPWLVADLSGRSWLISSFGEPLQPLDSIKDEGLIMLVSELPRLDGIAGTGDGQSGSVGARFRLATRMLRVLEAAGGVPFPVEGYTLLPEGGLVARPLTGSGSPEVVMEISGLPQVEETLKSLRIVLADIRKRGEHPKRIDMRFAGRAVAR